MGWVESVSMNLILKKGKLNLGFPFQSPTDLTYAVMDAPNLDAKLKLLGDQMEEWGWDKEQRERALETVQEVIHDGFELFTV